ncbi:MULTISPECIES: SGNH/GDSL hydrolase family protein [Stenotrophomonas]|uniref:SGNH/GDSL hydrolase family protein n=1 Tax=Stenotrophomonas TaxID=40323 RepID=UPI000B01D406|nr:SGNH/GDSL hydrolase family protein [Stenotrophomonas sp. BIIR7]
MNIVAFGHSVPAGYGDAPTVHKRDAYPRLLEDALVEAYPTAVLNVITAAVGGDNSTRGLVRLQREVLDFHPRSVSIDFGMNDLVIPLTEARANLTSIVEQIRNVGACPVLVTPTWYVGADEPDNAKNLKAQVAMIRDLGAALDVPVADAQKAFADFPGDKASLMATSNHPNRKGHELIAGQLVPIFVPAISAGPTR